MKSDMKKLLILSVFLGLFVYNLYGYWEWTPKTGKWINPKYAVKETDRQQWEHAESFRLAGNNEIALREYYKLVKHYPLSEYAPKALFESAKIYANTDKEKALETLDELIKRYPDYPGIEEVLKLQREISMEIMNKKRLKFIDRLKDPAKKYEAIFRTIETDPFNPESAAVALKLAEKYAKNGDMEKAMQIYRQIIKNFPSTEWEQFARYEMLMYEIKSIPQGSSDVSLFASAERNIDLFIADFPSSPYNESLKKKKEQLRNDIAGRLFQIASIYEKNGYKKSAEIYYKKVKTLYPETEYAKKIPPSFSN